MKIAITGHCHGLGKALYNNLSKTDNHVIQGFDIETGQDLASKDTISKIIFQTKDFDIFINNAYHETGQTEILTRLLQSWKNKNKIIVHIGTVLIFDEHNDLPLHIKKYIDVKKQQKKIIEYHRNNDNALKIILINPGAMETQFFKTMITQTAEFNFKFISVLDCTDIIIYTMHLLDKNIYIKELTLHNL